MGEGEDEDLIILDNVEEEDVETVKQEAGDKGRPRFSREL